MHSIVVVNKPKDWNLNIPDVEVVSAKAYLTDIRYSEISNARVYNLCQSYRYQGMGYYVSLLAEARGHRSFPNITTIQDLKSQSIIRIISDEIDSTQFFTVKIHRVCTQYLFWQKSYKAIRKPQQTTV
jgi:hypothetical protein